MGTLTDIGVLADGELGTSAKIAFIQSVTNILDTGFSIGTLTLAAGQISYQQFDSGDPDTVKSDFPAWNRMYIEGLLTSIAQLLDQIPDAGVLKNLPTPIFDPTKPILKIIVELKEIIDEISLSLTFPLIDILLSQLSIVLAKATDLLSSLEEAIQAFIDAIDPTAALEKLFGTITDVIADALRAAGEKVDEIIEKIETKKDQIIEKLNEIVQKIIESLNFSLPVFEIPILSMDLPNIDLTPPLIAVKEIDGFDGIITKFSKLMAAFITIPATIIESIVGFLTGAASAIASAIQTVAEAITSIITDVLGAIQKIFEALLSFIWEIISAVLDLAGVAFLEIASIINIVIFFTKYFIVSLIGYLIGAGLISYSAAQFFGIL